MAILRLGSTGSNVLQWQLFLAEQGIDPGVLDSVFGEGSRRATTTFQIQHGLGVDGKVGDETMTKARQLGFSSTADPLRKSGPNWPPKPDFQALTTTQQRQALFGTFAFRHSPRPNNPEHIVITDNWEAQHITTVVIPQLVEMPGTNNGRIRFHRRAESQLIALWNAWEQAGLLPLVLSFHGSFVPRFQRESTKLSNHAFGSAFDINEPKNSFKAVPALISQKGSVRELVPIANQHGFYWGGHFSTRPDGMHFEIARIV